MTDGDRRTSRAGTLAALAFTLVLIVFGVWIAQTLISMVRQQNCIASGRRDCLEMPAP